MLLRLCQELVSLGPDQLDVVQVRVQLTVNERDVETQVLRSLASVLTLAALVLIRQLGHELHQLVGEVSGHVFAGRVSDIAHRTVRSDVLLFGFQLRERSFFDEQLFVGQHLVEL